MMMCVGGQITHRSMNGYVRYQCSIVCVVYVKHVFKCAESHKERVFPRKLAVLKTEQILFHLRDGLICSEVYVSQ